jgi:flavin-dependent dehydrogenase
VDYDLVVIGGGIAGCSLGIALAQQHGVRVLNLEKEATFNYYPEMQQRLLALAVEHGCDVGRPAEVTSVIPRERPIVTVRSGDADLRFTTRLGVCADGRNSRVRTWSGLSVIRDPECLIIAGAHSCHPKAGMHRDLADFPSRRRGFPNILCFSLRHACPL